jgi:hypothetical protein
MFFATALAVFPMLALAQSDDRALVIDVAATVRSVDSEPRKIALENDATGQSEIIVTGPEFFNF